jgi:hypothetical protein
VRFVDWLKAWECGRWRWGLSLPLRGKRKGTMIKDILLDLTQCKEGEEGGKKDQRREEDLLDCLTGSPLLILTCESNLPPMSSSHLYETNILSRLFLCYPAIKCYHTGRVDDSETIFMPCLTKAEAETKNQTKRPFRPRPPPLTLFYWKPGRWRGALHSFVLSMLGQFPFHTYRLQ